MGAGKACVLGRDGPMLPLVREPNSRVGVMGFGMGMLKESPVWGTMLGGEGRGCKAV